MKNACVCQRKLIDTHAVEGIIEPAVQTKMTESQKQLAQASLLERKPNSDILQKILYNFLSQAIDNWLPDANSHGKDEKLQAMAIKSITNAGRRKLARIFHKLDLNW